MPLRVVLHLYEKLCVRNAARFDGRTRSSAAGCAMHARGACGAHVGMDSYVVWITSRTLRGSIPVGSLPCLMIHT